MPAIMFLPGGELQPLRIIISSYRNINSGTLFPEIFIIMGRGPDPAFYQVILMQLIIDYSLGGNCHGRREVSHGLTALVQEPVWELNALYWHAQFQPLPDSMLH